MTRRLTIALLLAVPLPAQEGRRWTPPEPDVKEARYGPHARNVLDLFKATSKGPTPLYVFIHGGGFRSGSKESLSPAVLRGCLEAGISVAAINYRLTDTAPFPAQMLDGGRAIQFLRSKAEEWNLDPGRFAAGGGSAGAGISLWLAFHKDLADEKSDDPVLRQSTRLRCVTVQQAQCSYDPRFIRKHIGGRAHEHPALPPFWGLAPDELDTEKAHRIFEECSPITHLTKDAPPVHMTYSGRDEPGDRPGAGIHNERFGLVLKAEMEKLGCACDVQIGGRDGRGQIEFLRRHLLGR